MCTSCCSVKAKEMHTTPKGEKEYREREIRIEVGYEVVLKLLTNYTERVLKNISMLQALKSPNPPALMVCICTEST